MPISQTKEHFENPQYFLKRIYTLPVVFKIKCQKKSFPVLRQESNSNFALKTTERSNHSFLLSI